MILELTATAEADLEAIGDHIARDNPQRAISFLRELLRSCLELTEFPAAWPLVPRYRQQGIRRRVHGRYLIFYRIATDRIIVLHILNGAMDIDAILLPDG